MNPYGITESFTLTKAQMAEITEKVNENKVLKSTLDTQNTTIKNLNKENKDLKKQIKKLQEDTKSKEQDMKKKFMNLHIEQKKVNSELGKYEAVPEFKGILDLYSELLNFRNEIDDVLKNDPTYQEKRKLDRKIEDCKQKNAELEMKLKMTGAKITAKGRTNELQQAENELRKLKEQSQIKYVAKKQKITEMTSKMKNSTTKLVQTITNALSEVQKHLEIYKVDLENIKKASTEFVEKPTYDKIMNILLEQQNTLMKDMIESNVTGMTAGTSSQKEDYESLYDSGSDSPDMDDVESIHGDSRRYKIMMHNLNEEWTDGLQDSQKVKAIIKTITTLSANDIEVERLGKINPGKKRPLKVSLPTFQHVQVILKSKHKLQNSCYSDIRICSYKKKMGNRPSNQPRKFHK